MQFKEFNEYIRQLQNFYGQNLSETELDVWYENLKGMSLERFNYVIAEIYRINKFMPRLSEILEVNKTIPYKAMQSEIKSGKCEKCGNTGYVIYTKEVDGHKYLYSAVCDCGRQTRYDGRQCQIERNKSDYYCPTIKEIGLEVKSNKPSREQVIVSMLKVKNTGIVSENIKAIVRQALTKI